MEAAPDRALLTRWVGPVADVARVGGSTGRAFRVDSADGSAYLCKRSSWRADDLRARYQLLSRVQHACGVILPLDCGGAPFFVDGNDPWELFPWRSRVAGGAALDACGAALGALHRALAPDVAPPVTLARRLKLTLDGAAIAQEIAEARAAAAGSPHAGEIDAALAALDHLVSGEAETFARLRAALPRLPAQWIHGDFHRDNVLATDGAVWVVDLDKLMRGPRAFDLAKFVMCEGFEPDGAFRADAACAFFDGYHRHARLAPDERAALPGLVAACHVSAAWCALQVAGGRADLRPLLAGYRARLRVLGADFAGFAAALALAATLGPDRR